MQKKRFVILEHATPSDVHWDVMLEAEGALSTWSISPREIPVRSFRCFVTKLPDHRLAYLDYEGEVSGGRGSVRRVDSGTYEPLGEHEFRLNGTIFQGMLRIGDEMEFV